MAADEYRRATGVVPGRGTSPAHAGPCFAPCHQDDRLPELFCGFHRREGEGPTRYPVACSPQAWSSGVVFQLLQASLRLRLDPERPRLFVHGTSLPPFLTWLRVQNLTLPFGEADLLFEQHQRDVGVTVLRKQGEFEICVLK